MKWFMKQKIEAKIFYISAILTFLFALLSIYNVHEYISKLVEAKQLVVSQQFLKVVNTYIEASAPYIFYTLALIGIGYLISIGTIYHPVDKVEEKEVVKDSNDLSDDELDNFLETIH